MRLERIVIGLLSIVVLVSSQGCKDNPVSEPNCAYSLSSTSQSFPARGGEGSVDLTTSSACSWTVVSDVSWIRITSSGSGAGNSHVTYVADANSGAERTGTFRIASTVFTVNQERNSAGCRYSISPFRAAFEKSGGRGSVNVSTADGCAWKAKTNDNWIRIISGSSGTGNAKVQYSVAPNPAGAVRFGTILIAKFEFVVRQSAATFRITGNVGERNVTIMFAGKGAPPAVVSDSAGNYSQSGFSNGQYTVIPQKKCASFNPESRGVVISNADQNGIDFALGKSIIVADAGGPYFQFADRPLIFSALNSVSNTKISTYIWDYGDGESDACNCPTPEHTYGSRLTPCPQETCSKDFDVNLTVIDANGCKDSVATKVTISFVY